MRKLQILQWLLGAPILLAIGLSTFISHSHEKAHRHLVLAEGRDALAVVRGALGIEAVALEWTDASGHLRNAPAWTGKPFARQFRDSPLATAQTVQIKYLDDPNLGPVIISQAAERERVNNWWISSSIGLSTVAILVCAGLVLAYLTGRLP